MDHPSLEQKRHSLAHILAMVVLRFRPGAKLGIGPAIEDGFYYDFQLQKPISEDELGTLTKMMQGLVRQNLSFERDEKPVDEAIDYLKKQHQPFKVELAQDLKKSGEKTVSFYQSGDFIDLCRGGHVQSTSELDSRSFKLTRTAGAYWKGSEKNAQLQRIYGVAFDTQKELADHLERLEEAKKRDHRKLGKDLNLFVFSSLVGSGLPLYTPKGALLRRLVQDYVEALQSQSGYELVWTPQIAKAELFKTSGHYEKFKADMFRVTSNYTADEMFLKPMNCPQHTQIYSSRPRSYRDLPIRLADFAMLYRDEKPGELSGLARVRSFSQDDCHIFCAEEQVDEEIDRAIQMTKAIMSTYGFKYKYRLSTRDLNHPEKYLGDPKTWDKVEKWAEKIMKRNGIEYYDGPGEAAFYAPKMDLIATDVLSREWQLSTIQIDYVMPQRFGLTYTGKDGQEKNPIMIHRAINGSTERFLAIIIEHFAGKLPVWLSPVQVELIPISEKLVGFANEVARQLTNHGVRSEINSADETVSKKIRQAQLQFVPYMLVLGEREQKSQKYVVRTRDGEQRSANLANLIDEIKKQNPLNR